MEEKRNPAQIAHLQKQYQTRITLAKNGQEAYRNNDFKNAIKYYNLYLKLLADINNVRVEQLSPSFFDTKTQGSEIFLISQIYWDLAKVYDLTPQLKNELLHALNKYVEFSLNYPFQVVNAESLRRFIRKGKCKNVESFQETYKRIYITSKMCYVASMAFGFDHPTTEKYRHLKLKLVKFKAGQWFVDAYYRFSPRLVAYLDSHPRLAHFFNKILVRPLLSSLAKFLLPRIM